MGEQSGLEAVRFEGLVMVDGSICLLKLEFKGTCYLEPANGIQIAKNDNLKTVHRSLCR